VPRDRTPAASVPVDPDPAAALLVNFDLGDTTPNPAGVTLGSTVPTNRMLVDPELSEPIPTVPVPVEPDPEPTTLVDPIRTVLTNVATTKPVLIDPISISPNLTPTTTTFVNGMHIIIVYPIPTNPNPVVRVNPTQITPLEPIHVDPVSVTPVTLVIHWGITSVVVNHTHLFGKFCTRIKNMDIRFVRFKFFYFILE
jgi:hypothetical protein